MPFSLHSHHNFSFLTLFNSVEKKCFYVKKHIGVIFAQLSPTPTATPTPSYAYDSKTNTRKECTCTIIIIPYILEVTGTVNRNEQNENFS